MHLEKSHLSYLTTMTDIVRIFQITNKTRSGDNPKPRPAATKAGILLLQKGTRWNG
jgi:hypothetical protein